MRCWAVLTLADRGTHSCPQVFKREGERAGRRRRKKSKFRGWVNAEKVLLKVSPEWSLSLATDAFVRHSVSFCWSCSALVPAVMLWQVSCTSPRLEQFMWLLQDVWFALEEPSWNSKSICHSFQRLMLPWIRILPFLPPNSLHDDCVSEM